MASKKASLILPIMMTTIFAIFLIPLTLSLIILSRLFKDKIQELFQRYGREMVINTTMMSNIKGLLDLLIFDLKQSRLKAN